MNSSDWCANENECKDSDGNRVKSSVKFRFGDIGGGAPDDDFLDVVCRLKLLDRGPMEAARDELAEEARIGDRTCGCCRILRRPDAPRPCSCSVMMEALDDNMSALVIAN
jgi:hypothetical protein